MAYKRGEIFYEIEKLAKDDVLADGTPYNGSLSLVNVNKKIKGTDIVGIDTYRGCNHACIDCYANRMSKISRKAFTSPVPVINFTGKIRKDKIYRIGTVGDPDHDWDHTSSIVKEMKRLGLQKCFFISKLQSIDGIDFEVVKNIQVSLDPLNKRHFFKTLRNIKKILDKDCNLMIRLRAVQTKNQDINRLQRVGINFARKYKIPLLETKVKFSKSKYLDALELYGYERINSTYQVKGSILKKQKIPGVLSCDEFNRGSCIGCNICDRHASKK